MALLPATSLNSAFLLPLLQVGQHLRSASTGPLQVPRARTTIGWHSFADVGPSLWNSLPAALQRPEMTLHIFKRQLKSYLFHIICADEQEEHPPPSGAVMAFIMILVPDKILPTYLLPYVGNRIYNTIIRTASPTKSIKYLLITK